jgi:hypothetical protein
MRKALFVSAHLPSPDANQAGDKTSFRVLEWLADRATVHFVGMSNQDAATTARYVDRLHVLCSTVEVVNVTMRSRAAGVLRHPQLPLRVAARNIGAMGARIIEVAPRVDTALFDHTQMLQYASLLPSGNLTRRVALVHDVLFQGAEREAEREERQLLRRCRMLEHQRLRRWELATLRSCDVVVVQAEKDRELLRRELPLPIYVMPPYVDATWARACKRRPDETSPACLFWGAMNRAENVDAVRRLARDILPLVRRRVPNVHLWVVGARPHRDVLRLAIQDPTIHVTGFVPDPRPYFELAQVSVAPLQLGAGIKVKVLESMLAGLPVVATSVAAEGIGASPAEALFVENTAEGFAHRVADLLISSARTAAIGRRARTYVEQYFGWTRSERVLAEAFCGSREDAVTAQAH